MNTDNLKRISDILHELDQRAGLAVADHNYDEALAIYQEILKAQGNLNLEKLCGHTMMNIANIYLLKEEYEKALVYVERASKLKTIQNDHKDSGNIQILRANISFLLQHLDEAEAILTREIKRNKNDSICGRMELMLFSHYMRSNRKSKARTVVDNAIKHFQVAKDKEELRRALECRVTYFKCLGQEQYARLDEMEIARLSV